MTHVLFDIASQVWSYIGLATSLLGLTLASFYLIRTLIFGVDVPGFASLIVSITFFAGIQLLSLGIIGEYIGRIFAEVKRRPLYLIEERVGVGPLAADDPVTGRAPVESKKLMYKSLVPSRLDPALARCRFFARYIAWRHSWCRLAQ